MLLRRFLFIGGLILTFITPVRAQDSMGLSVDSSQPGSIKNPLVNPPVPEAFKREIYNLNVPLKRADYDTQDFNFIPYTNYASAVASHCQIFKEQGQNLWWANCGEVIKSFAVVSNMDTD